MDKLAAALAFFTPFFIPSYYQLHHAKNKYMSSKNASKKYIQKKYNDVVRLDETYEAPLNS